MFWRDFGRGVAWLLITAVICAPPLIIGMLSDTHEWARGAMMWVIAIYGSALFIFVIAGIGSLGRGPEDTESKR